MTTPKQRKRPTAAEKDLALQTAELEQNVGVAPAPVSMAPTSTNTVSMPKPEAAPRINFDRGSEGSDISARSRTSGAFEPRGASAAISTLRSRFQGPARPGDLPLAVIDGYGFILPFSANNPMDRVILSQIPDVTFVYTEEDYRMVKEHNDRMLAQRRFEDTLQGAKFRMPPTEERHGFRNGREVVASFVDETMLNPDFAAAQFDRYTQ